MALLAAPGTQLGTHPFVQIGLHLLGIHHLLLDAPGIPAGHQRFEPAKELVQRRLAPFLGQGDDGHITILQSRGHRFQQRGLRHGLFRTAHAAHPGTYACAKQHAQRSAQNAQHGTDQRAGQHVRPHLPERIEGIGHRDHAIFLLQQHGLGNARLVILRKALQLGEGLISLAGHVEQGSHDVFHDGPP